MRRRIILYAIEEAAFVDTFNVFLCYPIGMTFTVLEMNIFACDIIGIISSR